MFGTFYQMVLILGSFLCSYVLNASSLGSSSNDDDVERLFEKSAIRGTMFAGGCNYPSSGGPLTSPGSSGSAVCDVDGHLIGMIGVTGYDGNRDLYFYTSSPRAKKKKSSSSSSSVGSPKVQARAHASSGGCVVVAIAKPQDVSGSSSSKGSIKVTRDRKTKKPKRED